MAFPHHPLQAAPDSKHIPSPPPSAGNQGRVQARRHHWLSSLVGSGQNSDAGRALPRAACLRSGCCPEACAPAAFQAALVHRHPSPHGWWPQKRLDLQSLQESVVPAALNSKLSHFARVALEWGHAGAPPAPRANPGEQRAPALENSDQQHTVDCGV